MTDYRVKYSESININESSLRKLAILLCEEFSDVLYIFECKDEKITYTDIEKTINHFKVEKRKVFDFKIILSNEDKKNNIIDNLVLVFKSRIEGISDYKSSLTISGESESLERIREVKIVCGNFVRENKIMFWQISKIPLLFISLLILLVTIVVRYWNQLESSNAIFFGTIIGSIGSSLSIFSMSKPAKRVKSYIFPKVRYNIGKYETKEKKAFILRILSFLLLVALVVFLILF